MDQYENILFVVKNVAGDHVALQRAAKLAIRNQAKITLGVLVPDWSHSIWSKQIRELTASAQAAAETEFRNEINTLRDAGIEPEVLTLPGKPWLETIRQVVQKDYDLVVLAPEPEVKGMRRMLFGSIIMNLVRKCPCPVWVPNTKSPVATHILVAVDATLEGDNEKALNLELLRTACTMAALDGAKVTIKSVVEVPGTTLPGGAHFRIESEEVEAYAAEMIAKAHAAQKELSSQVDCADLEVDHVVAKGNLPWEEIVKTVHSGNVSLVVMGSAYSSGIAGIFVGNNAEKILQHIECGVFTAKPDGFQTPVD